MHATQGHHQQSPSFGAAVPTCLDILYCRLYYSGARCELLTGQPASLACGLQSRSKLGSILRPSVALDCLPRCLCRWQSFCSYYDGRSRGGQRIHRKIYSQQGNPQQIIRIRHVDTALNQAARREARSAKRKA
jgi:hypothetical protein